jgi:hypothetical protein
MAVGALCWGLFAGGMAQDSAFVVRARRDAVAAARVMIDAAGYRLSSPVFLQVVADSLDLVAGGFSEALVDAGFTPRRGLPEGVQGSILWVRHVWADSNSGASFDVRIERMPERSVLYSRLLSPRDLESGDGSGGPVERLLVPAVIAGAAALIIYFLFTVRS